MFNELIEILETTQQVNYLLIIMFLYAVGYWFKNFTPLNNKLIPNLIFVLGGVLGFVLIQKTLTGAIMGVITAYITIAFHEHITTTLALLITKPK